MTFSEQSRFSQVTSAATQVSPSAAAASAHASHWPCVVGLYSVVVHPIFLTMWKDGLGKRQCRVLGADTDNTHPSWTKSVHTVCPYKELGRQQGPKFVQKQMARSLGATNYGSCWAAWHTDYQCAAWTVLRAVVIANPVSCKAHFSNRAHKTNHRKAH
jgi:hypothetical protein